MNFGSTRELTIRCHKGKRRSPWTSESDGVPSIDGVFVCADTRDRRRRLHRLPPRRRSRRRRHDVVVLDDLSTGFRGERQSAGATLVEGDVADPDAVARGDARAATSCSTRPRTGRSSARSSTPCATDTVNTHGTLTCCRPRADAGVRPRRATRRRRRCTAAPRPCRPPRPRRSCPARRTRCRSSRASTTAAGVLPSCSASRRSRCATSTCTAPGSDPTAMYAAVIPLFIDALLDGERTGRARRRLQTRDFTYIDDVVAANLRAAHRAPTLRRAGVQHRGWEAAPSSTCSPSSSASWDRRSHPHHMETRAGDVKHTFADLSAARADPRLRTPDRCPRGPRAHGGVVHESMMVPGAAGPSMPGCQIKRPSHHRDRENS